MNCRSVERMLSIDNAEEPCRLLKCFGTKVRHFESALRVLNAPFFSRCFTSEPDWFGDASHIREKRGGGGVEIDSDHIDARLHHLVEVFLEIALIDIMLVLPHTDRLGLHLDQFGQGILKAAANRDRAARGDIFVGKFRDRLGRGGVNRSARLVDNDSDRSVFATRKSLGYKGLCFSDALPLPMAIISRPYFSTSSRTTFAEPAKSLRGSLG